MFFLKGRPYFASQTLNILIMKTNWKIDTLHSQIGFKVKHMMITNVTGTFDQFDASIEAEDDDFTTAQFSFNANVDSINTGVADRDAHLKSEDFFNAASHPHLSFKSTGVKKISENDYEIHGDITLREVTKSIVLKAEFGGVVIDPYGQTKTGFSIEGKIKRSEFGLTWSAITEAGSIAVSDEVKLNCEIQFVKQN
jgi:polyisoprenoid-binding protein YceI